MHEMTEQITSWLWLGAGVVVIFGLVLLAQRLIRSGL
jgi:hypothetical protein